MFAVISGSTQDYNKAFASQTHKGSSSVTSCEFRYYIHKCNCSKRAIANRFVLSALSTSTDLTSGSSGFPKSHAQAFDKGFAANTPPPFNLPGLNPGSQSGALGGPPYMYIPNLPQQPAQMLAHPLHQVSTETHTALIREQFVKFVVFM